MGGALSYHVAEVVTCRGIKNMLETVPKKYISAIYKYVDDIFIIGDIDTLDQQ